MTKAERILRGLKPNSRHYTDKTRILIKLIDNPDRGHIIDKKLISWADKVGIKTELNCEDRTAWWTCRMK